MDLCYQTIKRCVVAVALWLVMSAGDFEAVPNATTRLAGCCAAGLLDWWNGCVSVVRTESKSLARVLTLQCFGSVSLSLAMHAAMPFVCMLLPLSVCMGVAESATAD